MEELLKLIEQFKALPSAIPSLMKQVFNDIKPVVEDLNTAQLSRGERADGSLLPDYSPVSVMKFGKPPGPMILRNRGDFWQGIELVVTDDGIELVGRDPKTEMLQLRYRPDIIGLQEESLEIIENDYLVPELEPDIEDFLKN